MLENGDVPDVLAADHTNVSPNCCLQNRQTFKLRNCYAIFYLELVCLFSLLDSGIAPLYVIFITFFPVHYLTSLLILDKKRYFTLCPSAILYEFPLTFL